MLRSLIWEIAEALSLHSTKSPPRCATGHFSPCDSRQSLVTARLSIRWLHCGAWRISGDELPPYGKPLQEHQDKPPTLRLASKAPRQMQTGKWSKPDPGQFVDPYRHAQRPPPRSPACSVQNKATERRLLRILALLAKLHMYQRTRQ